MQKLTESGMPPQQAQAQAAETDTGSQIAMWLGMGIGAIGLINAPTSEECGITNWLMALLGVGTAAGVAGYYGMLGRARRTSRRASLVLPVGRRGSRLHSRPARRVEDLRRSFSTKSSTRPRGEPGNAPGHMHQGQSRAGRPARPSMANQTQLGVTSMLSPLNGDRVAKSFQAQGFKDPPYYLCALLCAPGDQN